MPNLTFNVEYLLKLIGSKIEKEKLKDILYKLGIEVEHDDKTSLTLEITPNRPDLFSVIGLARYIRNFLHINKNFHYNIIKDSDEVQLNLSVNRNIKKSKFFIYGFVAKDIVLDENSLSDLFNFSEKLSDTLGRMRKKLSIGIHDYDTIDKNVEFKLSEDKEFINLKSNKKELFSEILKNTEKGKTYASALPKTKMYPILEDSKGVLALIPIINSKRTAVTEKTRNLFVEVTGTSEDSVRNINKMLAITLHDLGAKIYQIKIINEGKEYTPLTFPEKYIIIPLSQIEAEIGIKIGFNNIISLANKMGYEAALLNKKIRFSIPAYRIDILNEQDIIEDIAIGYGYDYIIPIPVPSITRGKLLDISVKFNKISDAFVGAGFTESLSTYLTNEEKNFTKMGLPIPNKNDYILLKDSKSSFISMARTHLLPSLLHTISISKHEKLPQKVFELDLVFLINNGKPLEDYHIAGVSTNNKQNFNDIKSTLQSVLTTLKISFSIDKCEHPSFIEGRCASIIIDGKKFGVFGELHPNVLRNFGIEEPSTAFELSLNFI
ncbi:MAG: phenylalanine--tRNA ligase subunit beta [Candidatus Micrarchaeaceae archaeon]